MKEAKRIEIQRCKKQPTPSAYGLIKSQRDLGSARRLMEGDEPYLDTAVYHCQQAAEKALKSFLTYHDIAFEKTHDLRALLEQSLGAEPAFEHWREVAEELTPYAVQFRYPTDVLEPERSEAERALQHAQAFVGFILHLLPEEVKP